MFAILKLSAISGFILPKLCTKRQKGENSVKQGHTQMLFLTFLKPKCVLPLPIKVDFYH